LRCGSQRQERSERKDPDPIVHKLWSKSAQTNIHPDVKLRCGRFTPGRLKNLSLVQRIAAMKRAPLQYLLPTRQDGFVAAVSSRAFREGTSNFLVNLSRHWNHHQTLASRARFNGPVLESAAIPERNRGKSSSTEVREALCSRL
jgi:hypothetical protein